MFPRKSQRMRAVYLDHAAATPLDRAAWRKMQPYFGRQFANPSGLSHASRAVRSAIDEARIQIASVLRTSAKNIIFTSGGTESVNLAVLGLAKAHARQGRHIISSAIEHPSVLQTLEELKKEKFEITYLPVDAAGIVRVEDVRRAIRPDTILITLMYANNEIGSVQPIAEIGKMLLGWRKEQQTPYPFFHTDACQATPYLPLAVDRLHVDLLSANGSKVYGPKGIGLLYVRTGVMLSPIFFGGMQEEGLRSGTEHVAGIIGFAAALEAAERMKEAETKRLRKLQKILWQKLERNISDIELNGPGIAEEHRLPNNLNILVRGAEAEALALYLDSYGIICSNGSACAAISDEASHVLRACGRTAEEARSSVRFTMGRETTASDITYLLRYLPPVIEGVRTAVRQSNKQFVF